MIWSSPERHGAMTGVMKSQIDWIPLSLGGVRPTQGKTLAVMQVSGGSQSFNTVNQLRILGRWMRLLTIPNQASVARGWDEFDDDGRMKPSSYYNRLVNVMEELFHFTLLTRDIKDLLVDRYSERVESHAALSARVNKPKSYHVGLQLMVTEPSCEEKRKAMATSPAPMSARCCSPSLLRQSLI